jgi:hypothetical protein
MGQILQVKSAATYYNAAQVACKRVIKFDATPHQRLFQNSFAQQWNHFLPKLLGAGESRRSH